MLPKIHIEVEKWKFNKNYNLYVSNMGNFKDKNKEDIKLMVEKGGYLQVPVCNNKQGKIKYLQAHRVVMETWCPKQNMWKDKLTVDHLDHNKRNNKAKNLEWVTQQENLKRAAADMIYDDKDALIQSLQDKIKNLQTELEDIRSNQKVKILVNGWTFNSWSEVKSYLTGLNKAYIHTARTTMERNIRKAAANNSLYCGLKWKIIY